jgi:hypothetical protein
MFLLVASRAAVYPMQAQLGERKIVKSRSLGKLSTNDRKQQRLHDQRVNRCRANQPSPEAQPTRLISHDSHAHELMLIPGVLDAHSSV